MRDRGLVRKWRPGRNLERWRADLTQARVAEMVGCSPAQWSSWESGMRPIPEDWFDAIAHAFGMSRNLIEIDQGLLPRFFRLDRPEDVQEALDTIPLPF